MLKAHGIKKPMKYRFTVYTQSYKAILLISNLEFIWDLQPVRFWTDSLHQNVSVKMSFLL